MRLLVSSSFRFLFLSSPFISFPSWNTKARGISFQLRNWDFFCSCSISSISFHHLLSCIDNKNIHHVRFDIVFDVSAYWINVTISINWHVIDSTWERIVITGWKMVCNEKWFYEITHWIANLHCIVEAYDGYEMKESRRIEIKVGADRDNGRQRREREREGERAEVSDTKHATLCNTKSCRIVKHQN